MQFGFFSMPSHPPERDLKAGHEWDLQNIRWSEELGFTEGWIAEHHTAPWEPHPAPDLLVIEGLRQTSRIRLGPGGFLLPYHHPAELANRVAMMDHLSEGRLTFGIAASGLPSDWAMFNVDGMGGVNRDMTREALDIILRLWSEEAEFDYAGKFSHVTKAPEMFGFLRPHLYPVQRPHPPIGVAGLSKNSDTLKLAGERGFVPMSLNLNPAYVGSHWEAVEEGAKRTGRTAERAEWRMVRENLRRRDRRGGLEAFGRRHDGADDEPVLPAALGPVRLPRLPEARPIGAGLRRHRSLLRQAQLADRLAGDRGREAGADLPRRRRLRHHAAVLLRLRRQGRGLARIHGAVDARGAAQGSAPGTRASLELFP